MRVFVLHGPNMNLLGVRNTEIYGKQSLADLNVELSEAFPKAHLEFAQSNCEGELIDILHEVCGNHNAIVFNPAAYTHYSYALRDAIDGIKTPVVEVHLTDIDKREDFRKANVVREVCAAHFQGKGVDSYKDALAYIYDNLLN